jgi:PPIC-type PPIASE domain
MSLEPSKASISEPPSPLRRLFREPLIHFIILAALLFAADHVWNRSKDDRKTIFVSAVTQKEARETFRASMKREPSEADLKILITRWLDNEILYREGLALGLDRGDPSIRERVIFKALSVIQSATTLPAIKDQELKQWFEANREKYDTPARFDFLEAVTSGDDPGFDQQALVDSLNGKSKSTIESSLRVFKQRPRPNLVTSYGENFTKSLEAAPKGAWILLTSIAGKHVVRLEDIQAGASADFAQVKLTALKDWREQTLSKTTTDTVRDLGKKYLIKQEAEK